VSFLKDTSTKLVEKYVQYTGSTNYIETKNLNFELIQVLMKKSFGEDENLN